MSENNNSNLSKKESIIQAVKFALFSASAGIIQTLTFTLLELVPGWLGKEPLPYWACYLPALVASVLFNFTVNRKFTFKSASNVPIAMLKVAAFYAVFTPVSTWLGQLAANRFGTPENAELIEFLVLAATMLTNLVTEFFYQKYFVFNDKKKENTEAEK